MQCDICIIGAGAAGLMAGIFAARAGADALVIEQNSTAGRKLLKTGRQRCNLTHAGSVEDFVGAYSPFGRFLKHSLYEFTPAEVRQFFADNGLETITESTGCVFPVTNRATDVKQTLLNVAKRAHVRFVYGRGVKTITKHPDGFQLDTLGDVFHARAVIIATGGASWPKTGSTGDGYRLAKSLSHTITQPTAALVPLITVQDWPAKMQGQAVSSAVITTKVTGRKSSSAGAMMFTGDGIGGPAVFDLSRQIADLLDIADDPVAISLDLLPHLTREELERFIIEQCGEHPKKSLSAVLSDFFARKLAVELCCLANCQSCNGNALTKTQRRSLIECIKALPLSIRGTRPIAEATITRGGITTDEIDPGTMQSKITPGLFFAGEVIDVDGPCGGYNLQIAWSTGALAGRSAAMSRGAM